VLELEGEERQRKGKGRGRKGEEEDEGESSQNRLGAIISLGGSRLTESDVTEHPQTQFLVEVSGETEEKEGEGGGKRGRRERVRINRLGSLKEERKTHKVAHEEPQSLHDIREENDGKSPRRVDLRQMRSEESSYRSQKHEREDLQAFRWTDVNEVTR